jgi:hypothetical protein|tara:strand:+ start:824 stop:1333 length:510 start_codon:yes stop_codon:yes gene_type:complete
VGETNIMARVVEKQSRTDSERDRDSRLNTIERPNWLDIPDSVKDSFFDKGYALKWVRISVRGEEDTKNIGVRLNEGWEFVTEEECPAMAQHFKGLDTGRLSGCVIRGDVALAKMPLDLREARLSRTQERTRILNEAVNNTLMRDNDSRAPITNASRTRARTGKSAHFDG